MDRLGSAATIDHLVQRGLDCVVLGGRSQVSSCFDQCGVMAAPSAPAAVSAASAALSNRSNPEEKTLQADNPHLAIEALRAVLTEEVRRSTRNNLVRQRAFSERLRTLMNKYTNQQLTSAEVIAELIALAREAAAERDRGNAFTPRLGEDELAFYDAVCENVSAVEQMGQEVLGQIARELVAVMRRDTKTDWTVRDDVKAKLRSTIKRLLIKHRYPPDKQPEAIRLVIDQMEALAPHYAQQGRTTQ